MEDSIKHVIYHNDKPYEVDSYGCLLSPDLWDEDFAAAAAKEMGFDAPLTPSHWKIINYIRETYISTQFCPTIYTTCRHNNLKLKDLRALFPLGYQRCACKLSGISYRDGQIAYYYWDNVEKPQAAELAEKRYSVDADGFIINPEEWDKNWAFRKAVEMKMPSTLNDKHWEILEFLRNSFMKNGKIPTVYETGDKFNLEVDDLEKLFPDGYHRGAVKLAGLKMRR